MMGTDQNSSASGSCRSFSQPPHLCQACLSVLERDNLEIKEYFPHHTSLEAFVEACFTRCSFCSYLLSLLDNDDQNNLMLLAAGKVPGRNAINKQVKHGDDVSEFTETHSDPVERDALFRDQFGQTTSWASFTMMQLTGWLPWAVGPHGNYWRVQVKLNPLYEGYIPPHLTAYRSPLKQLWKAVDYDWTSARYPALVLTQQGIITVSLE